MNVVILIGNAAADPELRHTSGGKPVTTLRLAVSRGRDAADFFDVVCWDRQAEVVAEYVRKGRKVAVEGRLQNTGWETREGEKRTKTEVVAFRVELLGGPRDQADDAGFRPAVGAGVSDDDIPF